MAEPKYQVFVSSTKEDLREARDSVRWELLKLGFIPVGMEDLSANPDRGWKLIHRLIDESDYFVVIVAGRYGTCDGEKSWTELEYEYALSRDMPVRAFVRAISAINGDALDTGDARQKLDAFRQRLADAHIREEWHNIDNLCTRVSTSLSKAVREDVAVGKPRPGWYRGPAPSLDELAKLSAEARELRGRLEPPAPELVLGIRQPKGNPGLHRTAAVNDLGAPSRWYHLRVWNNNRPTSPAHAVRVLLAEIWDAGVQPPRKIWDEEVPMKWTNYEGTDRTIGAPADADLCWVMRGERDVRLASRITPFAMPQALAPGKYIVVFIARGQETDSARLCVGISWGGSFSENEDAMARSLSVTPTTEPSPAGT